MNFIDLVFILLFIGTLAAGFFQGMIRLMVVIFAFYLSLVLASLYFPALANVFVNNLGARRYVGEYVGFAMILMFSFFLLAIAGLYTFRYAKLPGQLEYLDRIGGVLLGMLLGTFLMGIFAVLLYNLMIVRGGRSIDFPLMRALGRSVAGSFLLQYFANELLPQVYGIIDPVLPDGANLIFAIQQ